jgi:hypothetical protein
MFLLESACRCAKVLWQSLGLHNLHADLASSYVIKSFVVTVHVKATRYRYQDRLRICGAFGDGQSTFPQVVLETDRARDSTGR